MACQTSGSVCSMGFISVPPLLSSEFGGEGQWSCPAPIEPRRLRPTLNAERGDSELRNQLSGQVSAGAVDEAVPAAGAGGLDVGRQVIDEQALRGGTSGEGEAVIIDAPVRLADADL